MAANQTPTEQVAALLGLVEKLEADVAERDAKLDQTCGSCHPCVNWTAETWKRAGRMVPTLEDFDALAGHAAANHSEVQRMREQLDAIREARRWIDGGELEAFIDEVDRVLAAAVAAAGVQE